MEEKQALRQLPEIQKIAEYLRDMQFRKKLLGGVDAESVLEHFSAVTLQYEAIISALMQQADMHARQLAEAQALLRSKEEAALQQPWHRAASAFPQAQPMPYPPAAQPQNPWGYTPWAQSAPQAYGPQAYAPQAQAWPNGADAPPKPAGIYE